MATPTAPHLPIIGTDDNTKAHIPNIGSASYSSVDDMGIPIIGFSATSLGLEPTVERANQLGINIGAPLIWDATQVYADAMRQGAIMSTTTYDVAGWPLTATFDAKATANLPYTNGRWALYYDGTATVTGATPVASGGPGGTGPDGLAVGTNTRWMTFDVGGANTDHNDIQLSFTGAARNDGSGLAGLTNIKMMRPLAPGSTSSHRRDETVHRQVKSLVQRFGTVRYMDFLATNWSQITTWGGYPWQTGHSYLVGDRVTVCPMGNVDQVQCGKVLQATVAGTSSASAASVPNPATWGATATDGGVTWQWVGWSRSLPIWSGSSRNIFEGQRTGFVASAGATWGWQGRGGPYEDVIRIANETATDAWINIPHQVDDDYLTKVAQLFAFGSDGVMPYTSPQANPVYPPLASNLNLYVEYSNELWLGGFSQNQWINDRATTLGVYQYYAVGRQVAKISNAFRTAFGDAQMPYTGSGRIRPVVMGQGASQEQTVGHALRWMHEVLNDGDGTSHSVERTSLGYSSAAHPVGYYVYGAGGAPYWQASGADGTAVLTSMDAATQHSVYLDQMNRHVAIYGLPMLAYEGGPETPNSTVGTAANMTARPTTPNMTDVMLTNHANWSASGGGLFNYFTLTEGQNWSFVADDGFRGNIFAESPKMAAVDILKGATAAPITLSPSTFQIGTSVPGTATGGAYAVGYSTFDFGPAGSGGTTSSLSSSSAWTHSKAWAFLASASASRTVSVTATGGATIRVYVDGVQLGTDQVVSGTVAFGARTLGAGLHGVIVTAISGNATVSGVSVQ